MKRLYFITDSLDSAESISDDVCKIGVANRDFHVMSKNEAGLNRRRIHSSNIYHDNNVIQQGERGALLGAAFGAVMVILANFASSGAVALLTTLAVIFFSTCAGSWFGGFVGIRQENYKVSKFHDDLESGSHLVMIDVTEEKVMGVETMMEEKHQEARFDSIDSTLVMPF